MKSLDAIQNILLKIEETKRNLQEILTPDLSDTHPSLVAITEQLDTIEKEEQHLDQYEGSWQEAYETVQRDLLTLAEAEKVLIEEKAQLLETSFYTQKERLRKEIQERKSILIEEQKRQSQVEERSSAFVEEIQKAISSLEGNIKTLMQRIEEPAALGLGKPVSDLDIKKGIEVKVEVEAEREVKKPIQANSGEDAKPIEETVPQDVLTQENGNSVVSQAIPPADSKETTETKDEGSIRDIPNKPKKTLIERSLDYLKEIKAIAKKIDRFTAAEKAATSPKPPADTSYAALLRKSEATIRELESTLENQIKRTRESWFNAQIKWRKTKMEHLQTLARQLTQTYSTPRVLENQSELSWKSFEQEISQTLTETHSTERTQIRKDLNPDQSKQDANDIRTFRKQLEALRHKTKQKWLVRSEDNERLIQKNQEMKQELCVQLEKVLAFDASQEEAAFKEWTKIMSQWQRYGAVPAEAREELQNRFKTLSTSIQEKFKSSFEGFQESLSATRKSRMELIEQLKSLKTGLNESGGALEAADKEVPTILKKWKALKTDVEAHSHLHRQFKQALGDIFAQRKKVLAEVLAERGEENLNRKRVLLEKMEALATKDGAWVEIKKQALGLMKDWKETHPAPPKEGNALYKKFREHFDELFTKNQESFADNLKKKQSLLDELTVVIAPYLKESTKDKDKAATVDKAEEPSTETPTATVDKAEEPSTETPTVTVDKAEEPSTETPTVTVDEAEKSSTQTPAAKADSAEESAKPIDSSPAKPKNINEFKSTLSKVRKLKADWRQIGSAGREEKTIRKSFERKLDRFFKAEKETLKQLDTMQAGAYEQKTKLLATLEDLVHLQDGQEDTWAKANKKIRDLQKEWRDLGTGGRGRDKQELEAPYRALLDRFYHQKNKRKTQESVNHEKVLEQKRKLLTKLAVLTNAEHLLTEENNPDILRDLAVQKIKFVMDLNQKYRDPLRKENRLKEMSEIKEVWYELPFVPASTEDRKFHALFKKLKSQRL